MTGGRDAVQVPDTLWEQGKGCKELVACVGAVLELVWAAEAEAEACSSGGGGVGRGD